MSNEIQNPNDQKKRKQKMYDLEERTAKFGEEVIDFVRNLSRDEVNRSLNSVCL